MAQHKYLMNWKPLVVLATTAFLISGCSSLKPEKQIITQTEYVQRNIPIQAAPKPLTLNDVQWYVVTEENFEEFIEKYQREHGEPWVFYATPVRSYESMALNLAELRRYIQQQQAIILYYEEQVEKELETPLDN
jgi:hypothetical protein